MLSMKALLSAYAGSKGNAPSPLNLYDENAALPDADSTCGMLRLLHRQRLNKLPAKIPSFSKHIAICVVIVDELYHESIWRRWVEEGNSEYTASLHIHAKESSRITSVWVRDRIIEENHRPDWNSPEVIRAMLSVLLNAHQNTPAERFMFVTETCVPIYDLQTLGDILFADDRSWLNAYNTPQSSWEAGNCFGGIDTNIIPSEVRWKALPGWIVLTRRHASDIIGLLRKTGGWGLQGSGRYGNDLIAAFGPPGQWREGGGGAYAPEEMFFATMLGILGYLRPGYEKLDEIKMQSPMFAEWKKRVDANPVFFLGLNDALLQRARKSGAVMARKFGKNSALLGQWLSLILPARLSISQRTMSEKDSIEAGLDSKVVGTGKRQFPEVARDYITNHEPTVEPEAKRGKSNEEDDEELVVATE